VVIITMRKDREVDFLEIHTQRTRVSGQSADR
jgi:hypothetical protein